MAADGSSLAGSSAEAFAGLSSDELPNLGSAYYRFTRTGSGWITTPLNPVRATLQSIGLDDSVWSPSSDGLVVAHLSLVGPDGSVSDIGPVWPPALGPVPVPEFEDFTFNLLRVVGTASDASHGVVFAITNAALFWPFDTTLSTPSLYEYTGTGNAAPSLVGVNPGSTTLISRCGTTLGASSFVSGANSEYNAVSESGQRVFFTAAGTDSVPCGGTQPPANELFARINGSQTVAISEPTAADCPACKIGTPMDARDARFQGASADGSKVFFTTTQPLLGADTTNNLYAYDFNPPAGQPKVVRVSGGDSTVSSPTANVQGVSRISEDGSHVYFVATGVLTREPDLSLQPGHQAAREGAENLYVYERDAQHPAGRIAFIAELCSDAGKSGALADSQCPSSLTPSFGITDQALWGIDQNRPAQATPDGRFLAFTSYGDLTVGDTSSARQVFEYDAQTGTLVRVSIGQGGFNDNGNTARSGHIADSDASIVEQEYTSGERGGAIARTMSDDGSYVFFGSPVGLTPQALDHVQVGVNLEGAPRYAQNVYEYHDGNVYLISDGRDLTAGVNGAGVGRFEDGVSNVHLIGTSASGSDVFFATADPLVPQDTDTQVDFYDARINGGFPAPAGPAVCQGEGCQGPPSTQPAFGSPSSATFSGAGNLAPPESKPAVKPRPLNRAQKLAKALKACKKKPGRRQKKPGRRRRSCEAQARRRYGHTAKARKSDRRAK